MEFRLTCECGQRLDLTDGSAGSAVTCACGRAVQVPSLGELRRQFAEDVDIKVPMERGLTPAQVALLAFGLMVFGSGFVVSLLYFFYVGPIAGIGCLVAQAGQIWLLVLVIRECSSEAIFFAFVIPFFTWYFALKRWDVAKGALACNVGGIALTFLGVFLGRY
ncbi:MAG: hypothetical protein L0Y72_31165 [Gemmataceae bacterium]|nr:hypothetical protein [Gemmataceae bacterium]MCI0743511.1 hypothetical protein [Gemmataceae bacterium]